MLGFLIPKTVFSLLDFETLTLEGHVIGGLEYPSRLIQVGALEVLKKIKFLEFFYFFE